MWLSYSPVSSVAGSQFLLSLSLHHMILPRCFALVATWSQSRMVHLVESPVIAALRCRTGSRVNHRAGSRIVLEQAAETLGAHNLCIAVRVVVGDSRSDQLSADALETIKKRGHFLGQGQGAEATSGAGFPRHRELPRHLRDDLSAPRNSSDLHRVPLVFYGLSDPGYQADRCKNVG